MPTNDPDPAVSVCFTVEVDGENLGSFNSCEGLGLEIVMEQREEGGTNGMVWQLPSRMKFTNIKLSRPIGEHSEKLMKWIVGVISDPRPTTAAIKARTANGTVVAGWTLEGVIPVRWTGPILNVDTAKVATETFEIAHHGISPGK
jgi:phage tail-like protein